MEVLQKIVNEEVPKHPDDIEAAIDAVMARASRRKAWNDWEAVLTRKGIAQMVHDSRHASNVAMRKAGGEYGGEAKVMPGEATSRILQGVYAYMIAGKSLGAVTGAELPDIADSEAAKADGHQFNVKLCRALAKQVKPDKTVRECISQARLRGIFKSAQK